MEAGVFIPDGGFIGGNDIHYRVLIPGTGCMITTPERKFDDPITRQAGGHIVARDNRDGVSRRNCFDGRWTRLPVAHVSGCCIAKYVALVSQHPLVYS